MPRMWRIELRMATLSDEIDVRRALEKTRGVAEVLRAEPAAEPIVLVEKERMRNFTLQ
jgi:hypothetical protein